MKEIALLCGLPLALIAGIIWSSILIDERNCKLRWEDSGRKVQWAIGSGCRVSDKNGFLVPEKTIRDVQ